MLIYILEDDEQILEMMTYALQSSDYEVAGFQSAFALYQQLSQRLPSLILLDLMLPDEDGLTVLKKLRSDPVYQDLRIIIVSAKSSELDKVRGLDPVSYTHLDVYMRQSHSRRQRRNHPQQR